MNLEKVQNEITELQSKVEKIGTDLETKKAEAESKKRTFAAGLSANVGREKKLPSLDVQKRALGDANAEVEAMEAALELMRDDLGGLETEKRMVELFLSAGKKYKKGLTICENASQSIKALSVTIGKQIVQITQSANDLFKTCAQVPESFTDIVGTLGPDYSLRSFLNGELEEPLGNESEDRKKIQQELESKLRSWTIFDDLMLQTGELAACVEDLKKFGPWVNRMKFGDLGRYKFTTTAFKRVIPADSVTIRAAKELERKRERLEKEKHSLRPKQVIR